MLVSAAACLTCAAQSADGRPRRPVRLAIGGGPAWPHFRSAGLTATVATDVRPHIGIGVQVVLASFQAADRPADYSPPIQLFGGKGYGPSEEVVLISPVAVYRSAGASARRAGFAVEAGPTLALYHDARFRSGGSKLFSANYSHDYSLRPGVGFTGAARLEVVLGKGTGLGCGVWGSLNTVQSVAGVQVLLLGRLSTRPRKKHR